MDDVEFSGAVGWLRPRDPGALPSDFTVTIHWGDGRSSPGILEPLDDGRILIRVEHVFRLTQDNTDKAHEWYSIHVKTAVGHGTTFTVRLPVDAKGIAIEPEQAAA